MYCCMLLAKVFLSESRAVAVQLFILFKVSVITAVCFIHAIFIG